MVIVPHLTRLAPSGVEVSGASPLGASYRQPDIISRKNRFKPLIKKIPGHKKFSNGIFDVKSGERQSWKIHF
jgi:hypothetical protein